MASNYEAICEENRESYGTKGAQKSGKLAAGLYDDRTHFIFELLQNAEDALGRRGEWHGSRKVAFTLNPTRLTLSHFGKPFDEADVRSVCDIAESTKNESSIGRFGLGFKSVYTVTDLPEIHSGDEDFAIENYVFPKRMARSARAADETQNSFSLSPKKWIEATGAIGLYAKAGRGGGTYAHKDIAFEFGSWLSPEFKLYLSWPRCKRAKPPSKPSNRKRPGSAPIAAPPTSSRTALPAACSAFCAVAAHAPSTR